VIVVVPAMPEPPHADAVGIGAITRRTIGGESAASPTGSLKKV
jgi:hypothetical protein